MTAPEKTLSFVRLGAPLPTEAPLPPPPTSRGSYGLVYAPALKAVMYAPSTQFHSAGVGWTYDGAFHPFSEQTGRGSSVDGPWTAVWDTERKAVVVWAWDYRPGPLGFVLRRPAAPTALERREGRGEVRGRRPGARGRNRVGV